MAAEKRTVLLLGGAHHQVGVIEEAKRLGYRTVLCDYLPDNPGQYVADSFHQVSTTDPEAVLAVAREEGVEGVLSFGSDVALPTVSYVAEQLGLAANPAKAVETLSDKKLFRKHLSENGFFTPKFASLSLAGSKERLLEQAEEIGAPFVVKPTDSSGSKGVSTIHEFDSDRVRDAIDFALEYSRGGDVIVEEYVRSALPYQIGGDIFVKDGVVEFWGLMRAIRDNSFDGLVPCGEAFPCRLSERQISNIETELQRLVSSVGFRFGEMNLEVIMTEDDTPFILELGGRAGGNYLPLQLQDVSGINLTRASVSLAMGDACPPLAFRAGDRAVVSYVVHSAKDGIFGGVELAEEIRGKAYRKIWHAELGDKVKKFENSSDNIGFLFLAFEDADEMDAMLPELDRMIRVIVE